MENGGGAGHGEGPGPIVRKPPFIDDRGLDQDNPSLVRRDIYPDLAGLADGVCLGLRTVDEDLQFDGPKVLI